MIYKEEFQIIDTTLFNLTNKMHSRFRNIFLKMQICLNIKNKYIKLYKISFEESASRVLKRLIK